MAHDDGYRRFVIVSGTFALLLAAGAPAPRPAPLRVGQVTVRQQVIVRVRTLPAGPPPRVVKWKEKKAPRCMATDLIAGVAVADSDRVDFVLKGGTRLRAHLESDCPALDYYGGFYLAPTADRKVCADRDAIHARSGGECEITRFRTLVPDR